MSHPQLDSYLRRLAEREGATDLHVKVGSPPRVRVKGVLEPLPDEPPFDKRTVEAIAAAVLPQAAKDAFVRDREAECTYAVQGLGRFRVAAYLQRGSIALILRLVQPSARSLDDLNLPAGVARLAETERGLVVVAAPPSSGLTTTLAGMVHHLNARKACHIVTVEDPVEVLHRDDLASISQRQVGVDVPSVAAGVRSALRQDPDVVVVGHVDDADVARAVLAAAESGRLVIAGVVAPDVPAALTSFVALFPEDDRARVQLSLAGVLAGAVAVRLVATRSGVERIPAVEVLRMTPAAQAAILADDVEALRSEMGRNAALGMQTLNQDLARLLHTGAIDEHAALATTPDWQGLRMALEQRGFVFRDA